MRKIFVVCIALIFCISAVSFAFAQEAKKTQATPVKTQVAGAKAPTGGQALPPGVAAPGQMKRPNFSILSGSVTKVNTSDPKKQTIEVKSDADNTVHVVEVTPFTNVAKMTDVSEIKTGESVRVMARKMDDKEVAMSVMFGKIKALPMPPKVAPAAQTAPAKATKAAPQKP